MSPGGPSGPNHRRSATVSSRVFPLPEPPIQWTPVLLSKVMLKISTVMFFVATLHFCIGFYRDWIAFRGKLAGPPETFLAQFDTWHRVMQDTLFVIQETLGAGAAVR